jgi:hypothetical protein
MGSTQTTEHGATAERLGLRPVPAVVDWIVGALLALVGFAMALGGTALFVAIDRSEIREAVADEEIQSDVLTDPELVDVTQAVATWTGVGLIAIGAVLVVVGLGFAVLRHRAHRRAAPGEPVRSYRTNALYGAIVTVVLSFVPLSQILGGVVAGYLEVGSSDRVLGVGALSGVLSVAPVLALLAFVLGGVVAGLLEVGEGGFAILVAAALLFTAALLMAFVVALGAFGGYVGGKIGNRERDRADSEPAP